MDFFADFSRLFYVVFYSFYFVRSGGRGGLVNLVMLKMAGRSLFLKQSRVELGL